MTGRIQSGRDVTCDHAVQQIVTGLLVIGRLGAPATDSVSVADSFKDFLGANDCERLRNHIEEAIMIVRVNM